jgi:MYXO-CTERM domain-containing protein
MGGSPVAGTPGLRSVSPDREAPESPSLLLLLLLLLLLILRPTYTIFVNPLLASVLIHPLV